MLTVEHFAYVAPLSAAVMSISLSPFHANKNPFCADNVN